LGAGFKRVGAIYLRSITEVGCFDAWKRIMGKGFRADTAEKKGISQIAA
jgi:hypothetical protein